MTDIKDINPENFINFFAEEVELPLKDIAITEQWIINVLQNESCQWTTLNFIFCSDEYLHKINVDYLNHDTYTDVITFPYSIAPVEGDIYISVDRIRDNAKTFGDVFDRELHRVIIHGVMHLIGYDDKSPEDKKRMTLKENQYLSLLSFLDT
jgi:rRNA maturation RNase YbeY